jgi:hypothetical protein
MEYVETWTQVRGNEIGWDSMSLLHVWLVLSLLGWSHHTAYSNPTTCRSAALQNDHYFSDSMQRFLDMLTKRMHANSSSSAANDANYASNISQALAFLASAGIAVSKEELELLPAQKKQVRLHKPD